MQNKVIVSEQAQSDLENILYGLIHWKKGGLEKEHAHKYVDDIVELFYLIPELSHHFPVSHAEHKQFGEYVYRYRRTQNTMWYIIYNIDKKENVFINKIISNHITT